LSGSVSPAAAIYPKIFPGLDPSSKAPAWLRAATPPKRPRIRRRHTPAGSSSEVKLAATRQLHAVRRDNGADAGTNGVIAILARNRDSRRRQALRRLASLD
jgi:hypothetical protein